MSNCPYRDVKILQTCVCWCLCESRNVFACVFACLSVYVCFVIVWDGKWLALWAKELWQRRLSQAHRPAFKARASVCIQYVCSPWTALKCHQPKCPGWECVLPLTLLQEGIRLTTLTCHRHHANHLHVQRENINTTGWNWDICHLVSDRKGRYAFFKSCLFAFYCNFSWPLNLKVDIFGELLSQICVCKSILLIWFCAGFLHLSFLTLDFVTYIWRYIILFTVFRERGQL